MIPGVRMRSPAALGGVRGELLELSPLRRGCGGGKVRRGRRHWGGTNFLAIILRGARAGAGGSLT